jgi:hypothetical protein
VALENRIKMLLQEGIPNIETGNYKMPASKNHKFASYINKGICAY